MENKFVNIDILVDKFLKSCNSQIQSLRFPAYSISNTIPNIDEVKDFGVICIYDVYYTYKEQINNIIGKAQLGTTIFLDCIESMDWSDIEYNISVFSLEDNIYIIRKLNDDVPSQYTSMTVKDFLNTIDEVIICATAKQEYDFIKDWVEWHLRLGFDRIYIYDNNSPGGETYDDLLKEYIEDGRVTLIDVRGMMGRQCKSYKEFVSSHLYKWCCIIDIDEFIKFKDTGKYNNIHQFIDNITNDDTGAIVLEWRCFKATGRARKDYDHIYEANVELCDEMSRMDSRNERTNGWLKSIYRICSPKDMNEHFGWGDWYGNIVDCNGDIIYNINNIKLDIYGRIAGKRDEVVVNHYLLRDIDSFYKNKYNRGHAGVNYGKHSDGFAWYRWAQNWNYYTDHQEILTEEEQAYLRTKGLKPNYTFRPDTILYINLTNTNKYYNDKLLEFIINNILTKCDCDVRPLICSYDSKNQENNLFAIDQINFICTPTTYYHRMTSNFRNDNLTYKYQQPIIIYIGLPHDIAFDKKTDQEIDNYLNSCIYPLFNNLESKCQAIINDPSISYIHQNSIVTDSTHALWQDAYNKFLEKYNIIPSEPDLSVINNVFITSYDNYKHIVDIMDKFSTEYGFYDNNYIYNSYKAGYSTYDDLAKFIWPAVLPNMIHVM